MYFEKKTIMSSSTKITGKVIRSPSPFEIPDSAMSSSLLTQMGGAPSSSSSSSSTTAASINTTATSSAAAVPINSFALKPPIRRIARGARRQSALLMEQLTRELDRGPRRTGSTDLSPYETVSNLIGMTTNNLGPTGRSGSMTLSNLSGGGRRRSRRLSGESASLFSDFSYAMMGDDSGGGSSSSRRDSLAMFAEMLDPAALQDLRRRSSMLQGIDFSMLPGSTSSASSLPSSSSSSSMQYTNTTSSNKRKTPSSGRGEKTKREKKTKRVSNRSFEARRRTRVNNAMKQLKVICLRATKAKSATKIEVLEMAIGMLAKVRNETCMDFQHEYDAADAGVGDEITAKAQKSGAHDIRRSIRERKRRVKVNILEAELSRLALATADSQTRSGASKCQILERACASLGDPVPPMSDDEEE